MIGVDHGSYSFNAATSQVTINLEDGISPKLEGILLITNVTDNIIIYNFANPTLGGTLSNNVLTLTYSTVAMSNNDKLQIWYYIEGPQETNDSAVTSIVGILASNGSFPDAAGRTRVLVDTASTLNTVNTVSTVTTVSTITTLSTLTNITNIGGYSASTHIQSTMQIPIEVQLQKIVVT